MERPQRLARRHEQTSAEFYGAQLTLKSGSGDVKGDAYTVDELFEFKHTEQLGFRLRIADWLKHRTYALISGRRPVWEIQYTNPNGSRPRYVVVLDRDDYLALRDELERQRFRIEGLEK